MNAQAYQNYPPQAAQKVDFNEPQPSKQSCGFIVSIIATLMGFIRIYVGISSCFGRDFQIAFIFNALSGICLAGFHIMAMSKADYLKGKPALINIAPLFGFALFSSLANLFIKIDLKVYKAFNVDPPSFEHKAIQALISGLIISAASYFIYGADDDSASCCLCFKPWIHKRVFTPAFYPGLPPQAYPHQQAYPQNLSYPPQAYPQLNPYPPQVYPHQQQAPYQGKPAMV